MKWKCNFFHFQEKQRGRDHCNIFLRLCAIIYQTPTYCVTHSFPSLLQDKLKRLGRLQILSAVPRHQILMAPKEVKQKHPFVLSKITKLFKKSNAMSDSNKEKSTREC